jgi:hypothetical protein
MEHNGFNVIRIPTTEMSGFCKGCGHLYIAASTITILESFPWGPKILVKAQFNPHLGVEGEATNHHQADQSSRKEIVRIWIEVRLPTVIV